MTSAGSRVPEQAAKLYDACLTHFEADRMFFQEDLLSLGVIPTNDLALLVQCAQSLVDQKLMRLLQTKTERLAWKIIPREDAEKYGLDFLRRHYHFLTLFSR
jgi:DNA-directed RNA polymerase III subunit RPC6